MTDTAVSIRHLLLTQDEWRAIAILVNNAEHDADQERLKSRIDSPQERAFEADQLFWQSLQEKLRGG